MPYSSRLPIALGLVLLAWSGCLAQSQDEASQIAPSPTTMAASAQDNSQTLAASVQSSAAVPDASTAAAAAASASISGPGSSIQPSMTDHLEATSVVSPQQSSAVLAPSSVMGSVLESSAVDTLPSASAVVDSSSAQVPVDTASILASNYEEFSSSEALASMLIAASMNSTLFVQSTSMEIQPSDSMATAIVETQSEYLFSGSVSVVESLALSSSVQQSLPLVPSSSEMYSASIAASVSSSVPLAIPESSGVIAPSSTVSVPPSSSAVVPVPVPDSGSSSTNPAGEGAGNSPTGQGEKQKGGGGGMSSGAKAAVGIFVTLAIIGLITMAVVLYRRNYFTPRNLKSLMKGGVRYQTHDDSMSYNDEMDFH